MVASFAWKEGHHLPDVLRCHSEMLVRVAFGLRQRQKEKERHGPTTLHCAHSRTAFPDSLPPWLSCCFELEQVTEQNQ